MNFLNSSYDYIILDLDNTLYDEYNFIESCIGVFLKKINYNNIKINNWKKEFKSYYIKNGNNKIFDNFIQSHFDISEVHIDAFLNSLRESNHDIINMHLYDGVICFLQKFKNKISIVTDGNIAQQIRKVKILNLNKYIDSDKIFYSDSFEGKSSNKFKLFFKKELKIQENSTGIVIGDNPKSDGVLAKNINFKFYKFNENSNFFRQYL